MNWTIWAPLLVALLGVILILDGLRHLVRRRVYRGGGGVIGGVIVALIGLGIALIGLNMATYARLSYERPVAEVTVHAVDPARKLYAVAVRRLDTITPAHSCELQGDEWIIGGHVRRWKPWVNLLGLDSGYTLDQLANKYVSADEGEGKPITVCDIESARPTIDRYVPGRWLTWLMSLPSAEERHFGSASYMPLADGAVYTVVMTQAGLNAEPANEAAKAANNRG
jgi:hypothetical protein